jgi:hypothetical protein
VGKEYAWTLKIEQMESKDRRKKMVDCSEFSQKFFEESSKAWKGNKVRIGEGMYRYKKNAFPKGEDMPEAPKLTRVQQRTLEKEIAKRQGIDEYAPPRVRRSSRLRNKITG